MPEPDLSVCPVDLCTDDDSGLACCAKPVPSLRWGLQSDREGVLQHAYEIERAADPGFSTGVVSTGRVPSEMPFDGQWPGAALASREVTWCRARVWTDRGVTGWSAPLRLEGTLLEQKDWVARPVSPRSNVGRSGTVAVPLLRRSFGVDKTVLQARLYVTALGIFECWVNGRPVSSELFEPGWTAYRSRHLFASYDVSDLLHEGENVLSAAIGDGWWRGNLTWMGRRAIYGDTTALLAQMEIKYHDGSRAVIATDGFWRGSTGSMLAADFYNGCEIDLSREQPGWREPGFDDSGWEDVVPIPLPGRLEQRSAPPVRVIRQFGARPERDGEGRLIVDARQNLTGYLRLAGKADSGGTIVVRHAEVLEADGSLQTAALRSAKATDTYHIGPGDFDLSPSFTYHGFRYAELHLPDGVSLDAVQVCVVASDLAEIGSFECSDDRLNQLDSNVRWSQRGNFLAIPTDCPQRDERLGWTGDIQVFAPTACTNFDSRAFLESWLADLACEQASDGQVPSTVPNVIQGHEFEFGGIGWGDAATLVPWALHEAYGSKVVLERQFDSMRGWVDWGSSRLDEAGTWVGDFHLGDWLDPGAPPDRPQDATTDRDFIASSYLAFSAGKVAAAARLLGHEDTAQHYRDLACRVAEATWRHWQSAAQKTQAGCAILIAFGIAPEEEISGIGRRLATLVERSEGRIATGFLGTPLVLPALTLAGQHDATFRLLLNEQAPGWLYQVVNGATTMWERWDAILPDGSINRGIMAADDAECMTSFNHYAYGAVGAWLYRSLAGIAPDEAKPGYRLIHFAPQPGGGITRARARIESPFGPAAIRWVRNDTKLHLDLEIPPGAQAHFQVPQGWAPEDSGAQAPALLGSGRHRFTLAPC
ncbi:alpha-L-rhamnosidase [Novosphingobium endophyticum]|uniref:alpha-L-rhamnosidase n=1 Tax=Novosphingobium endophyticum TaxID=1955250 RepID=UPI001E5F0BD9|nr:alpha-L-rhamnosidase [Novosphingobium endophyticum]